MYKIQSKSSYGYDAMSNNLIKHAFNCNTNSKSNTSHSYIPKISRLNPIHQSGGRFDFCNYELFFVLPSMSKVIE